MPIRPYLGGVAAFCLLVAAANVAEVRAHATGENYVWVNVDDSRLEGRFEISSLDLTDKLGIPIDMESAEEVIPATAGKVQEYLQAHFRILVDGKELPYTFTETKVFITKSEIWAQYYYETPEGEIPNKVTVQNSIFLEDDRLHRSLLVMDFNKKTGATYAGDFIMMIFSPTKTEQELDLLNVEGLMGAREFVWQGIIHIWEGTDHVLFLVALLLPAVLVREGGKWMAVPDFRKAFWNILKIVTIFTLAHSITLGLAALDMVQFSSRLVESVIALSIVLVGLNTIFPKFGGHSSALVIFAFGLFHGFGFASVMGELPFRMLDLFRVLISFNVGVELGQIAIVAAIFPVIYLIRNWKAYQPLVLRGGTAVIVLIASYWFVERAFGF